MLTVPSRSTQSAMMILVGAKGSDEPALVDWRRALRVHDHQLHRPPDAFAAGALPEGRLSLVEYRLRVSRDRISFRVFHRSNRPWPADRPDRNQAGADAHRCIVLTRVNPDAACQWVLQFRVLPLPAGSGRIRELARRHQGSLGMVSQTRARPGNRPL